MYLTLRSAGEQQVWKAQYRAGEALGQPIRVIRGEGSAAEESPAGDFVYFVRTAGPNSLWRATLSGANEQKVATSLLNGAAFSVGRTGIVIATTDLESGRAIIEFLPAHGGSKRRLHTLGKSGLAFGLSIRSDGGAVAWSHFDRFDNDLMLIRNFR